MKNPCASAAAWPCATEETDSTTDGRGLRPENAIFNPEGARRQLGLEQSAFARIFDCIWLEVSERRSLLEEAIAIGDLSRVALHAHTIKSSAATIGAEGLSQAAAAMEKAADAGCMDELITAYQTFRAAKETLSKLLGMG